MDVRAESDLERAAHAFASKIHLGQSRKGKYEVPYIHHPEAVADLIRCAGGTKEQVAAGYLHDTVYTRKKTAYEISDRFGIAVGDIVDALTDPPEFKDLPTPERKRLQAERIKTKSDSDKMVKLADVTQNTQSVIDNPRQDWDKKKCMEHVRGNWGIAQVCRGINAYLDRKFEEAYHAALAKFSN